MPHRWNELLLQDFIATCPALLPREFAEQVFATRLLGGDGSLALYGGGNTSFKTTISDLLGEPVKTLLVKSSGSDMGKITSADFVALDLIKLQRLDRKIEFDDQEMANYFKTAMVQPHPRNPSIETLLHAFLPFTCVDHTHPDAILALTNRHDSATCIAKVFPEAVAVIPYATVGIGLARACAQAIKALPGCRGVIISHHGLVTWGDSAREAFEATMLLVEEADTWLKNHGVRKVAASTGNSSTSRAKATYRTIAPLVRVCCTPKDTGSNLVRPVVSLSHLVDDQILAMLDDALLRKSLATTPLTPDNIIRIKRLPLLIDHPKFDDLSLLTEQFTEAFAAYHKEYQAFIAQGSFSQDAAAEHIPRVIMLPGVGVICSGATAFEAEMAAEITAHSLSVKRSIYETGGTYLDLDDEHCLDMEFRSYQRAKLGAPSGEPLCGRVVLVTGAAGAIGSGICAELLEHGCQVAVSDLPGAELDAVVKEFCAEFGSTSVVTVPMDVTDEASVHEGFGLIIDRFGGLDAAVVNAGIAHVATLATLEIDAFRKLERVNTDGTLLTIREAARLFELQKTGGDIVLVSTKNVFAPGASFGAYSATKAAAHQIARIASIELAPIDVRVNMVAPDAVFSHGAHKSGLWATVGPGRMKSRGLDEAGLEEYYRNRNLLKVKVTATHVAIAVEFFLERRTPTTGATIPVDGGLPDATPR